MAGDTLKPVYVLHGRDGYLLDHHRKRIIDIAVGDSDPQMCVSSFDATAELAEVLDELRTIPFLAPCRVVLLREAEAFITANRTALEDYVASPSENGVLVLFASMWRSNTRLHKAISKIGEVIDCSTPESGNLTKWLQDAAGRRGKKLSRDAAGLLAEWSGGDLSGMDGEIEKL